MVLFRKENYNPLMFLSALWPGWMSVTFFMYLMFIVPRDKKWIIPTFDSLSKAFNDSNLLLQITIVISLIWIIFFALKHFQLLIWNLKRYFEFKKTEAFQKLKTTDAEVNLMALPLTLAMTVNVVFILWAVFVPNLWSFVEYLFPFAIISFGLIWILALKIFSEYFVRIILDKWDSDFVNNNSLSQMLSVFAFVMIAVWFAASAAMSEQKITVLIWLETSIFFSVLAIFLLLLKIILWFAAIFKHWLDRVASPSLWIMIPILTLLWITYIRQIHGLHEFGWESTKSTFIVITAVITSLQIIFWYIWYQVMKQNSYFTDYLYGEQKAPWTYSLLCPWVAIVVFSFFFLHTWLVWSWIVPKFGIAYFLLLVPIIIMQILTIKTMFILNKKFGI